MLLDIRFPKPKLCAFHPIYILNGNLSHVVGFLFISVLVMQESTQWVLGSVCLVGNAVLDLDQPAYI